MSKSPFLLAERAAVCLLIAVTASARVGHAQDTDIEQALDAWRAEYGAGWDLELDPETDVGMFLWGGALRLTDTSVKSDAEQAEIAKVYVELAKALHGLESEYLVLDRCVFLPLGLADTTDKTVVRFRQEKERIPVVGGFLSVLLSRDGTLLSIESGGVPGLELIDTLPLLPSEAARSKAVEAFTADTGIPPTQIGPASLVIEQVRSEAPPERRPVLAWRVPVRHDAEDVPYAYVYSMDARSGARLLREDAIHYFDVTGQVKSVVTGNLYPPNDSGATTVDLPVSRATVHWVQGTQGDTVLTAEDGTFVIPGVSTASGPVAVQVYYEGEWADVDNYWSPTSDDYVLAQNINTDSGTVLLMNPSASVEVLAQANAYYWVNQLRQWIATINPSDMAAKIPRAEIRVNGSGANEEEPFDPMVCLPHYEPGTQPNYLDSYVSFNKGGLVCRNNAYSSSIIHEMGHWLNDRYGIGNPITGMGEGNADVYSMYLLGVPELFEHIAPQAGYIRTGDNSRRYCGNNNQGCYENKHDDGWPLMGALWKLYKRLQLSEGSTNGALCAAALHNGWVNVHAQTQIRDSNVLKLLLLDDDDADVRDGTPHYADITRAFMEQGWPDMLPGGITFTNVSPQPSGYVVSQPGAHTIAVNVQAVFYPPLASQDPVTLFYRVNGGGFQALSPFSVQGNVFEFSIPAPGSTPAKIEYYISATDSAGQTLECPPTRKCWTDGIVGSSPPSVENAPFPSQEGDYFFYFVGTKDVLFESDLCSTCESDFSYFEPIEFPWTGWEFGEPLGSGETTQDGISWTDPAAGFSGSQVWRQDSVVNSVPAPNHVPGASFLRTADTIDTSGVSSTDFVMLRFRRWLTVDRAERYLARVVAQFSDRAVVLWKNHRAIPHVDTKWSDVHLDITPFLDQDSCIPWIEWDLVILDNTFEELGGWNIDDVEIYRVGPLN